MKFGVNYIGDNRREDYALVASSIRRSTPLGTKRPHDSCSHLDNPCTRATPNQNQQEPRDGDYSPPRKRARLECPSWSGADGSGMHAMKDAQDDHRLPPTSPIAWLSDEIRLHIARYCSLVDLGRLACVSRDWCRVASDPHLCARTYDLHVGRCRFDHLCHGVTTDVVSDPAFFTDGLAALGVPDDADASETTRPVTRDGGVPIAPEAIPSWATNIGRALAKCCARIARSAAETRGRGTLYEDPSPAAECSGDSGGLLQTCRHVPPTFIEAFGVGAAYRASTVGALDAYAGPRFSYQPTDADSQPRHAPRYDRPMGAYMWPCRISASPPRHTACLYTDGPRYSFETDVALALMLADADGRTVWAHAWSRSSTDVTVDSVAWYCAGPFPRREALYMDLADDTSEGDQDTNDKPTRAPRVRPPVDQMPLVVCRRFDGTVACARAGRRVNRKTGVRYILNDAIGPCLMETAGSRTIYRGGLAMGVRSGRGTVQTANGVTIYDGLWDNDLPGGEGKLYDTAGRLVFSGTFRDGAPGAGPGLLCVPSSSSPSLSAASETPTNVRPCKVYGSAWETLMAGSEVIYATPRGDGHITLADGTRLDCRWSHPRRPPSVLRVHVSARSTLSLDGRPCVLDLTVAPPSFYDDALALLEDVHDHDDDNDEVMPIRAKRVRGAKAVAVHVEERHQRDCVSAWRERIPSELVATCPSQQRGMVAEPCEWIVHALASPSLSFAVDLAPHRPGRLVVNLLDAPRQT
nr:F-box domain containing protein [Pandoravirus aubagnensis]